MLPGSYGLIAPALTCAIMLRYERYREVMIIIIHTILNVASLSQFLIVIEPNHSTNLGPEFPQGFDHQFPWLL